jgi:hypothetical protein
MCKIHPHFSAKKLLREYGCQTEEELAKKLYNEGEFINCIICGIPLEYNRVVFVNDDPFCPDCSLYY